MWVGELGGEKSSWIDKDSNLSFLKRDERINGSSYNFEIFLLDLVLLVMHA